MAHDVVEIQQIRQEGQDRDRNSRPCSQAACTPHTPVGLSYVPSAQPSSPFSPSRHSPTATQPHQHRWLTRRSGVLHVVTSALIQLDRQWLMPSMSATYPRDTVLPVLTDEDPAIDRMGLASLRPRYRRPAYHLSDKRHAGDYEMPGDDRPFDVPVIDAEAFDGPARPETVSASTGQPR